MSLAVHFLPVLVNPTMMTGHVAVVIDILRATTTIVHALAAGVDQFIPCGEVDQAQAVASELAASLPPGAVLLGGERHGQRIPGFDLDNSPLNFTADILAGKSLVMTTTNGTRAIGVCLQASRVLLGAFVNLRATVQELLSDGRPVHLVCAGTDGCISGEDVLFAGAVAEAWYTERGGLEQADDETRMAVAFWRNVGQTPGALLNALRACLGAINLIELGFDPDIVRAAEVDRFDFAAEYQIADRQIRRVIQT